MRLFLLMFICFMFGSLICFFYSFLYESNLPLDAYRLQEEEVTGIIKMEIGQAIQLFSGKIHTSRASGMRLDENGSWRYREFEVQRSDFAPHADDYYMKIFEAAKQYFDQGNDTGQVVGS
ncbi:MAG: hypothetical protein K6T54_12485 [Ignavibacterium sp.]|nr:hypothetical protein [Ignavibacterium sp.]